MGKSVSFYIILVILIFHVSYSLCDMNLKILHTNDMHSRFEETNSLSTKCSSEDAESGKCYGGMARLIHKVREERQKSDPTIFLNAGDTYQGTAWFTVHKWKIVARFINLLDFNAISLGNHEFDNGVDGLIPFINNVSCPVVAANLDLSEEPRLAKTHLSNYTVLEVSGKKIAVIGYLTPSTTELSLPQKVKFIDEVVAIKREIENLKKQGIDIFIALGHSGYQEDITIAKEVPDIDIVIGGHTNTFLYTGTPPDSEIPESLYPTIVEQPSGRKVPVVQAYAYTKYLGQLNVVFDDNGELKSYGGNPILLNSAVPQDQDILDELAIWREEVKALAEEEIGRTKVLLDGEFIHCRLEECNLGNMIADAMVFNHARDFVGNGWTDAPIAIQHGGGIRNSINPGPITREDIVGVLPFDNAMILVQLKGEHVLEMLEASVKNYDRSQATGGFLQFSGMQVTYDVSKEPGHRVVSALARCGQCRVPILQPVQKEEIYGILVPSFLVTGGDGYTVFEEHAIKKTTLDTSDIDMVVDYIQRKSPVYPSVQGRIKFVNSSEDGNGKAPSITLSFTLFLCCALFVWNVS